MWATRSRRVPLAFVRSRRKLGIMWIFRLSTIVECPTGLIKSRLAFSGHKLLVFKTPTMLEPFANLTESTLAPEYAPGSSDRSGASPNMNVTDVAGLAASVSD